MNNHSFGFPSFENFKTPIVLASIVLLGAYSANADSTWIGASGADWGNGANWSGGIPSGVNATFNTALTSVVNTGAVSVKNITFDTNAGTVLGTFTVGALAGGTFSLAQSSITQITASIAGSNKTILFNAPITIGGAAAGTHTFQNLSADSTNTLNFAGPISSTATTSETLILGGVNTGNNTISGVISDGTPTSGLSISKQGAGTWVLSAANTYSGATTVAKGTLVLDFSASGAPSSNIIKSGNALTLGFGGTTYDGGTLLVKGKSTGSAQTLGVVTLTGHIGSTIVLDSKGGTGTTLTIGSFSRNIGSTLFIDASSANTSIATTLSAATLGYAIIKDSTGIGFARANGTNLVRLTGQTTLAANSNSTATDYITSGNIVHTGASLGVSTLTIDTTSGAGSLNLSGGTLDAGQMGILSIGANSYTISNGAIGLSGKEIIVHTMGTGGLTISGSISIGSTGRLIKNGADTLTLSAANTYSGRTDVLQGTLKAGIASVQGVSGAFGWKSAIILNNAANTNLDISDFDTTIGSLSGGGDLGGNVILGSHTLTLGEDNTGPTFYGVIKGTGGLTKIGTGSQVFGGINTYTGTTTINAGTIQAGIASVDGVGGAFGLNSAIQLANVAGVGMNLANFSTSVGSLSGGGVTGGSTTLGNATLTTGGDNTSTTYAGVISGNGGLTKIGSGTQTLAGTSNYTGVTAIKGGVLNATTLANGGANSAIGASGTTASNLVLDSGTLQYTGAAAASTDRRFTLTEKGGGIDASGATLNFANTSAVTFTGNGSRTLTLSGTSTGNNTLAAILGDGTGGATSLAKKGTGTWVLTGANTYTGNTIVDGGVLSLANTNALGTSGTIAFSGGILQYSASNVVDYSARIKGSTGTMIIDTNGQSLSYATALNSSNTGGLKKLGAGTLTLAGVNSYTGATEVSSGALAVNGSLAEGSAVTVDAGATLNGTGSIGGAVVNSGTIAGSLTFNNDVTINNGAYASASAFNANITNNGSITGGLTVQGGKTLSGGGSVSGGLNVHGGNVNGSNLSVTGATVFSGSSNLAGSMTSSGGISVASTGILNVTGSTSSSVTVNSATLKGSGSTGNVVLASGTLNGTLSTGAISGSGLVSPGNSPGILTATSVTSSVATGFLSFAFELTTGVPDYTNATSSLNDVLHITSSNGLTLEAGTSISVYFSNLSLGSTNKYAGGFFVDGMSTSNLQSVVSNATFSYYAIDGNGLTNNQGDTLFNGLYYTTLDSSKVSYQAVDVTDAMYAKGPASGSVMEFTVVPEPSTWAMLIGGVGMLGFWQRSRRRLVK